MHAHTAPALFRRPLDDADLANRAVEYGMRGFVLKDHDANTTGRAYYVAKMFPQVQPFGAIVLNRSVGGLNPYVAQAAIHYGARSSGCRATIRNGMPIISTCPITHSSDGPRSSSPGRVSPCSTRMASSSRRR